MEPTMEEARGHRSSASLATAETLLALGILGAPLALGTVHLWSLAALVGVCFAAAFAASLSRPRRPTWPLLLAFAVVAWVGLQALPLPPGVQRLLSPDGARLVDEVLGEAAPRPLSLAPAATARELARLAAYAAALYAASRVATNSSSARRRLAMVVVAATLCQLALVVVHQAVATDAIYGLVRPGRDTLVLGSFGNGNLLSAFLTLGAPLLFVAALREARLSRKVALFAALAAVVVVVVLTLSRSGLIGLVVALFVLRFLLARSDEHRLPLGPFVGGLSALLAGAIGLAFLAGGTRASKLLTLVRPAALLVEEKVLLWRDTLGLIRHFPVVGVGRGAFEEVLPAYRQRAPLMTFTHVENGALQALADLGLLVGGALLVGWLVALFRAARHESRALHSGAIATRSGIVAALAGITCHELGDFALEASGAVGVTTAVLFGLVTPSAARLPSAHRLLAPALVLAAALAAAAGLYVGYAGDLGRQVELLGRLAQDPSAELMPRLEVAMRQHPAEPYFPYLAGVDRVRHRQPAEAMRHLNRALVRDPRAWRPHVVVGEALWLAGRRDQALLEFRLAYAASQWHDTVLASLANRPGLAFADGYERFAGDDPALLDRLADFLARAHRREAALQAVDRLLVLRPGDPRARLLAAKLCLQTRRFAEALRYGDGLTGEEALVLRAQALDALGRESEADALLTAARPGPPQAASIFALAERWLRRHDASRTLSTLARLPEAGLPSEELARLHLLRARALEQQGRVRDAILELVRAARIQPSEANRMALGEAYERAGLLRFAYLSYRDAVRLSPSPSAEAKARLARFEATLGNVASLPGTGGSPIPVVPSFLLGKEEETKSDEVKAEDDGE